MQRSYQDDKVAREYVATRFVSPLGAMLHDRQVRTVQRLIREHGVHKAIEIAPGPARLTVDVAHLLDHVTLVDSSEQMLREAESRLKARGLGARVHLSQGDAFNLAIADSF